MQNRSSRELFDLIKGMQKWEKKSFNLYVKRNSHNDQLKVISIFKAINTMEEYNEEKLIKKIKDAECQQLPNLKAFLYQQILDSLRIGAQNENILLQLHQLLDHAIILFGKGYFIQSQKVIHRVKTLAASYYQISFLFQAVVMERKIELQIGHCETLRLQQLEKEMNYCNQQLSFISLLSNQSILLQSMFNYCGMIRYEEEGEKVNQIHNVCADLEKRNLSFYPKLYFLQAKVFYYLLKREKELLLQFAGEWVAHFEQYPKMKAVEAMQYHKGIYLLGVAAHINHDKKSLYQTLQRLKDTGDLFYLFSTALNVCLSEKRSDEDLIDSAFRYVQSLRNPERLMTICCQAAQLCCQQAYYERAIDFINIALNQKTKVRIDLQYKIRLMQLDTHRKLKNDNLVEYLMSSTRRFAKRYQLSAFDDVSFYT